MPELDLMVCSEEKLGLRICTREAPLENLGSWRECFWGWATELVDGLVHEHYVLPSTLANGLFVSSMECCVRVVPFEALLLDLVVGGS